MFNENVREFSEIIVTPLEERVKELRREYYKNPNRYTKQKLDSYERTLLEYYRKLEEVVREEYLFQKELLSHK